MDTKTLTGLVLAASGASLSLNSDTATRIGQSRALSWVPNSTLQYILYKTQCF